MLEIFRNMWRRKFRTFLTVIGITVGIFAFTVMGSMALKLNKMIDGGKRYITGQITVAPKGSSFTTGSTSILPIDTIDKIAKVEGVNSVQAGVEMMLEEPDPDNPTAGFNMGPPPTIEGMDMSVPFKNRNWQDLEFKEGRMLERNDPKDSIVLGISIATDKNLHVGDKITIRGREFNVIGVLEKTMTGPDNYAIMDIQPAREMYVESNPFLKSLQKRSEEAQNISEDALNQMPEESRNQILEAKSFKIEDVNTAAAVDWKNGEDPEKVVDRIKDQFKDEVTVLSPKKMGEEIDKASAMFNAIILGSALIALIVGGFSIINTMVMSISERTKEIGIKKAIGASGRSIALEYTLEAGIIGFLGGLIGMALGVSTASIINHKMASQGAEIFLIEPGFIIEVLVFAFVLGIIAGIIPAIRAAKMKAVDAIREL